MTSNSHISFRAGGSRPNFDVIGMTLPRLVNATLAIAVSRAGGIGVLDLDWGGVEPWKEETKSSQGEVAALQKVARLAKGRWGIKLDGEDESHCKDLVGCLPCSFELAILTDAPHDVLVRQIAQLHAGTNRPKQILLEITGGGEVPDIAGIDGFIAKGHESGGIVGDETTFILLQRLSRQTSLPIWAQGGIGLHSAAACRAAGAAGVVLDAQLCLTRESNLPESVRSRIARMDGSEAIAVGEHLRRAFRSYHHPSSPATQELQLAARDLEDSTEARGNQWKSVIGSRVGWGGPDQWVWPLGQDAALASKLAERFETAGRIASAIRESTELHLIAAASYQPLAEGSALARSHGTRFPIVQGPMTRVSDNAAFGAAVAEEGALPFIALALSNAAETRKVLEETRASLGPRPWGVGILGFVPLAVRTAQLNVIRDVKPAFALIAGGRPDQALSLEREGIATYLHTPSPHLLKLFFEQGARRFVFEGRECGGHVGPRCSFVLWDEMIEALLSLTSSGGHLRDVHVLFAGGIHDALSASMVAALAAPLAQGGAKVGVLLGTAYLFTHEVVQSGALTPAFQAEAVRCQSTALLESGPGHASRCARTAFVEVFEGERKRLTASGASADEIRSALESLNLGRLRIAAKGLTRLAPSGSHLASRKLVQVDSDEQRANGMYMLGQVAALRHETCSIGELHRDVSEGGSSRLESLAGALGAQNAARPCDVAIIGVATMLPKAPDVRRFWENILAKVDTITEIPSHRFDWRQYYDPDPAKPDKIYSKWGGFLDDVAFDPVRYGMPPHTLASIEPMQLLTLEAVRSAIADAGYAERPFIRSKTSVILGVGGGLADLGQQYGMRSGLPALTGGEDGVPAAMMERLPSWTEDSFAGLLLNVAAGRVANRFDLGGVNFTVDAACASSLAAIYTGVRELESGASDVALVGGVDTVQNPFGYLCFSKTKALSPRGRCRPFDAEADGIVISEGLAILVLKRLVDAERDGDRVYAVIKSIAGSSDGRDKGLTAPRPEGQVAALQRAYEAAGINPATVGLVEAHGTGTAAGDVAEVEALKRVFTGSRRQGCALGSVKSMIGHTKCAAGAAGLVKATLALYEKVLPPTLHVQTPNPKMDFADSPFFLNTETRPWIARPDGISRRAGVSAFGFGGTNFHVVLEEYADDPATEQRALIAQHWPSEILVWSANSRDALRAKVSDLIRSLDGGAEPVLADLSCALWQEFNKAEGARLAVVANSLSDLRTKLGGVESSLTAAGRGDQADPRGIYLHLRSACSEPTRVAFLFPGQSSQHVDMLAELAVAFPEVRESFEEADRLLASQIPEGVTCYIFPPSQFTEQERADRRQALSRTEITQPAMGAACMAMLALLQSMGLRADVVAGHSYGEYVALAAAGVFSKASLYSLSAARGKCLAEGADPGGMLAVLETVKRIKEIIAEIKGVWIANVNSPRQTVLSGTQGGLAEAKDRLSQLGIDVKPVQVSCAFHSPLVARAKERLATILAATEFLPPQLPVFSNTSGDLYPQDSGAVVALLSEHLVRPVQFKDEVEAMYKSGVRTFVEVGPRGVLTGLVGQILAGRPHVAVATGGERSSLTQFHHALAQLIVEGTPLSLDRLYAGRVDRRLELTSLMEKSDTGAPPPGTWLVNGGRARRLGEPAMRPTAPTAFASPPTPSFVETERPPRAGASLETDAVMVRFQESMSHFLETQRQTMLAYLGRPKAVVTAETQSSAAASTVAADEKENQNAATVESVIASQLDGPETLSIGDRLCAIISERTGYPMEMLKPTLNLEADLGIDSIKRVEILGAFQRSCNADEQHELRGAMEKLTSLKTIGSLIDALGSVLDSRLTTTESTPVSALPRFVLSAVQAPATPSVSFTIPKGVVLITDDGRGVASRLASELRQRSVSVVVLQPQDFSADPEQAESAWTSRVDLSEAARVEDVIQRLRRLHGCVAGVIHLLPLRDWSKLSWQRQLALETKGLFLLARATGSELRSHHDPRAVILVATSLGGDFAVGPGKRALFPVQGGVAGILKTLAWEWPEVDCKLIDFEFGVDPEFAANRLLAELYAKGPVEIGYQGDSRIHLQITPAPLPTTHGPPASIFEENPIVLVTGGARGITAKAAIALASKCRGRILVVGKSALPPSEESSETAVIESPRQLKSALIERIRRTGGKAEPAAIEAAWLRLLQDREIRHNLRAIRETGAEVHYLQCDLASADEFSRLLDEIYSSYGAIHGVIHGAGVIDDRLLENKDSHSFDRVLGAKVTGAMVLADRLKPDMLRFLAFFSSVSGRFGNRGQADYAAANEVLNKLAAHLDARWPARVVAINWGPWDGSNMVGESVRDQFVRRGVQLIEASAGCSAFVEELLAGRKGEPEVVLGGGPWGEEVGALPAQSEPLPLPLLEGQTLVPSLGGTASIMVELNSARHRYLTDHRLDTKPVLPATMAIELMAEAAKQGWPDSVVTGVKSVRVCKGIVVDEPSKIVCVSVKTQTHHSIEDRGLTVDVDITDPERAGLLYYRGTVCLSDRLPLALPPSSDRASHFGPAPLSVAEAYGRRLFHGPRFHCLKRIMALNERGSRAQVSPSGPEDCMDPGCRGSWIIDPILLDAGPQLLILWAQQMRGMTALPSRFGEVRIFDGLAEVLLAAGTEPVECCLLVDTTGDGPIITASFQVFSPGGEIVLSVEKLESTCSESLNRLAIRTASMEFPTEASGAA